MRLVMLKDNLLALVDDHRLTCKDENCPVMLTLILELAERAGLEFSSVERKKFL